jgi:hypothetical protein
MHDSIWAALHILRSRSLNHTDSLLQVNSSCSYVVQFMDGTKSGVDLCVDNHEYAHVSDLNLLR